MDQSSQSVEPPKARGASQRALSSSIKSLEEELGQLLFDRIGKRIELTSFGLEVLTRS